MAASQILIVKFDGGLFENENTERKARIVMLISISLALLFAARTALALAEYTIFSREEGYDPTTAYVESIVSLLFVCFIPYCGFVGARDINESLLCAAGSCSGICAAFTIVGTLTFVIPFELLGYVTCFSYEDFGLGYLQGYCWAVFCLNLVAIPLFCINAYTATSLYQESERSRLALPDTPTVVLAKRV